MKQSAAAAGGLALYGAAQTGAPAANPPNERIRYALIGCGGQGIAHVDSVIELKKAGTPAEIVAVSGVYSRRLEEAVQKNAVVVNDHYFSRQE